MRRALPQLWLPCVLAIRMAALGEATDPSLALFERRDAADVIQLEAEADRLLTAHGQDICALLVKAGVLTRRGRLAESLRHHQLAVQAALGHPRPETGTEPHWPSLARYDAAENLRMLNRPLEQVALLDAYLQDGGEKHEARNRISYPASRRRAEALLKLGRAREALGMADAALAIPGLSSADRAGWSYTKAVILSYAPDGGDAHVRLLSELIRDARRPDPDDLYQRGHWLLRDLDWKGARADCEASFHCKQQAGSAAFPSRVLAQLHAWSGEWAESVEWSGKAWDSLRGKTAPVRQDLDKDMRCTAAGLALVMGYPDFALQLLSALPSDPPRFGGTLSEPAQWKCWTGVTRWLAVQSGYEFRRGEGGLNGLYGGLSAAAEAASIREEVLRGLSILTGSKLPPVNALDCTDQNPLLLLSLVRMLGPSTSCELLSCWPVRNPALQKLMAAENAWRDGQRTEADQKASEALELLDPGQKVLRSRALVIRGAAGGDSRRMIEAWQIHPSSLLLAGERIPVSGTVPAEVSRKLAGLVVFQEGAALRLDAEPGNGMVRLSVEGRPLAEVAIEAPGCEDKLKRLLLSPLPADAPANALLKLAGQTRSAR